MSCTRRCEAGGYGWAVCAWGTLEHSAALGALLSVVSYWCVFCFCFWSVFCVDACVVWCSELPMCNGGCSGRCHDASLAISLQALARVVHRVLDVLRTLIMIPECKSAKLAAKL